MKMQHGCWTSHGTTWSTRLKCYGIRNRPSPVQGSHQLHLHRQKVNLLSLKRNGLLAHTVGHQLHLLQPLRLTSDLPIRPHDHLHHHPHPNQLLVPHPVRSPGLAQMCGP